MHRSVSPGKLVNLKDKEVVCLAAAANHRQHSCSADVGVVVVAVVAVVARDVFLKNKVS